MQDLNPFKAFFQSSYKEWHHLLEGDGLGDRAELEKQLKEAMVVMTPQKVAPITAAG